MTDNESSLWIILNTDMESMTPGRAAAQAAHAGSYFGVVGFSKDFPYPEEFKQWFNQTQQGFGTVYVWKKPSGLSISRNIWRKEGYFVADVIDPSYRLRDGNEVHHVSVITSTIIFDHDGRCQTRELEYYQG